MSETDYEKHPAQNWRPDAITTQTGSIRALMSTRLGCDLQAEHLPNKHETLAWFPDLHINCISSPSYI